MSCNISAKKHDRFKRFSSNRKLITIILLRLLNTHNKILGLLFYLSKNLFKKISKSETHIEKGAYISFSNKRMNNT